MTCSGISPIPIITVFYKEGKSFRIKTFQNVHTTTINSYYLSMRGLIFRCSGTFVPVAGRLLI